MTVVVVYKKKLNSKPEMAVFNDGTKVDDIISSTKRKPLIPNNWTIEEIGIGESFIDLYSKKFKITKKSFNPIF